MRQLGVHRELSHGIKFAVPLQYCGQRSVTYSDYPKVEHLLWTNHVLKAVHIVGMCYEAYLTGQYDQNHPPGVKAYSALAKLEIENPD